jgi:hypothetical protein
VIRPKVRLLAIVYKKPYTSFDSKMISLKKDLVVNNNSWQQLIARAYKGKFLNEALGSKNP